MTLVYIILFSGLVSAIFWAGYRAAKLAEAETKAREAENAAQKYRNEAEIRAKPHPDKFDDIVDRL